MKQILLILTVLFTLFAHGQSGDTTQQKSKIWQFWKPTIFNDTIKYTVNPCMGCALVSDSFGNVSWFSFGPTVWLTGGNAGTNSAVNFLGTTDTAKLNIGVNDTSLIQLSRKKINLIGDTITHSKGAYSGAVLTSDASGNGTWQGSVVYHVRDSISSTQILNSYTSPDTLIPAAGVGYSINMTSVRFYYAYSTSTYTIASIADLFEGDTINPVCTPATFPLKNSTASQYGIAPVGLNTFPAPPIRLNQVTSFDNKPVTFYSKLSNPTGGSGYLIIYIDYTIQKD